MKVSVLIAAYQAVKFLPTALESVSAQDYPNWELVVTEDGSDDGTRAIVHAFADQHEDRRIKYTNSGVNRGVSATRNRCLSMAAGDAVAFLDADDYWKPTHLSGLVTLLQAGHGLAISPIEVWSDSDDTRVHYRPTPRQLADPLSNLFERSFIQTSSCVAIAKTVCDEVGNFDETLQIGEDRDYWLRALLTGRTLGCCEVATCCYRKHDASAMTRTSLVAGDTVAFYQKHQNVDVQSPSYRKRKLAQSLVIHGRLIRAIDRASARRSFFQAWRLMPWRCDFLARTVFG